MQSIPAPLAAQGLNLLHVFDLAALPSELAATLGPDAVDGRFRQVILIGHLGRDFWNALQRRGCTAAIRSTSS